MNCRGPKASERGRPGSTASLDFALDAAAAAASQPALKDASRALADMETLAVVKAILEP